MEEMRELSYLDVVSMISLHTTRLHGNFIVEWLKLTGPKQREGMSWRTSSGPFIVLCK